VEIHEISGYNHRMKILALEPYYGGSHKSFLDGWISRSEHQWNLLTQPASQQMEVANAPLGHLFRRSNHSIICLQSVPKIFKLCRVTDDYYSTVTGDRSSVDQAIQSR
jgi:hypothetical protein